jgi:hypothetical protein
VSCLGDLLRGKKTCGPCADDEYGFHAGFLRLWFAPGAEEYLCVIIVPSSFAGPALFLLLFLQVLSTRYRRYRQRRRRRIITHPRGGTAEFFARDYLTSKTLPLRNSDPNCLWAK